MHVSSSPAIWYAARASGVAAYVVLSVVVSLGLTLGGKAQNRRWPRFSVEDVHRFGGLLVGSLIGVHVLAIAADSYLPFSLTQLLVPFTSSYRPVWTGLGIAAAELLVALAVTNHYRRRLPYRFWRLAHYLNFAVWTFASLHGLMAGTDRGAVWLAILYGVSVATVLMLLLWRFGRRASPRRDRDGGRRDRRRATAAHCRPAASFAAAVERRERQREPHRQCDPQRQPAAADRLLRRAGTPSAEARRACGPSRGAANLESTSLQLEYLPSGDVCRGRVTQVGGESFSGTCRLPNGEQRTIEASWVPNEAGTAVVGNIRLRG